MAEEPVEQGSAELSTDETTDETTEPIELPFEEQVMQRLDALGKDVRDTNARISGVQSIYDRNTAQIKELQTAFTEEYGTSKKALSLFAKATASVPLPDPTGPSMAIEIVLEFIYFLLKRIFNFTFKLS